MFSQGRVRIFNRKTILSEIVGCKRPLENLAIWMMSRAGRAMSHIKLCINISALNDVSQYRKFCQ